MKKGFAFNILLSATLLLGSFAAHAHLIVPADGSVPYSDARLDDYRPSESRNSYIGGVADLSGTCHNMVGVHVLGCGSIQSNYALECVKHLGKTTQQVQACSFINSPKALNCIYNRMNGSTWGNLSPDEIADCAE